VPAIPQAGGCSTAAMRQARYEIVEDDGAFYGEIPAIPGVWANARTLEACLEELKSVLGAGCWGWVLGAGCWSALPIIPRFRTLTASASTDQHSIDIAGEFGFRHNHFSQPIHAHTLKPLYSGPILETEGVPALPCYPKMGLASFRTSGPGILAAPHPGGLASFRIFGCLRPAHLPRLASFRTGPRPLAPRSPPYAPNHAPPRTDTSMFPTRTQAFKLYCVYRGMT